MQHADRIYGAVQGKGVKLSEKLMGLDREIRSEGGTGGYKKIMP